MPIICYLQVAIRNIRREAIKAYEKLEKVATFITYYLLGCFNFFLVHLVGAKFFIYCLSFVGEKAL